MGWKLINISYKINIVIKFQKIRNTEYSRTIWLQHNVLFNVDIRFQLQMKT